MGAESMTQLFAEIPPGQAKMVKAFSNARKLFQISKLPIGVLTYGGGNIGTRSVESFLSEFSESLSDEKEAELTVDSVTTKLLRFIRDPYDRHYTEVPVEKRPPVGFYVAGYSPRQHLGSEWEFVLPNDPAPRKPRPDDKFGASWRGVSVPFTRLHFGVDPRLPEFLHQEGLSTEDIEKVQRAAAKLAAPVVFDGMPVQDAIGYCRFILETTIGQATYEIGAASCGGPLQLAVITRAEGFRWISKPEYTI